MSSQSKHKNSKKVQTRLTFEHFDVTHAIAQLDNWTPHTCRPQHLEAILTDTKNNYKDSALVEVIRALLTEHCMLCQNETSLLTHIKAARYFTTPSNDARKVKEIRTLKNPQSHLW